VAARNAARASASAPHATENGESQAPGSPVTTRPDAIAATIAPSRNGDTRLAIENTLPQSERWSTARNENAEPRATIPRRKMVSGT
jgi:hypothetical protein